MSLPSRVHASSKVTHSSSSILRDAVMRSSSLINLTRGRDKLESSKKVWYFQVYKGFQGFNPKLRPNPHSFGPQENEYSSLSFNHKGKDKLVEPSIVGNDLEQVVSGARKSKIPSYHKFIVFLSNIIMMDKSMCLSY